MHIVPAVRVSLHTAQGKVHTFDQTDPALQMVQVHRQRNRPGGFVLNFASEARVWGEEAGMNDLVVIELGAPPYRPLQLAMVGWVKPITDLARVSDREAFEGFTVVGLDFIGVCHELAYNIGLFAQLGLAEGLSPETYATAVSGGVDRYIGAPAEVIQEIVDKMMYKSFPRPYTPQRKRLVELVGLLLGGRPVDAVPFQLNLYLRNWRARWFEAIAYAVDMPWGEIYTEVAPPSRTAPRSGTLYRAGGLRVGGLEERLVYRGVPWPYWDEGGAWHPEEWERLPLLTAPQGGSDRELKRVTDELYSFYSVSVDHLGINATVAPLYSILDKTAYNERVGYRPLAAATNRQPLDSGADVAAFMRRLTWQVATWNSANEYLMDGTLTYPLLPHVAVGTRWHDPFQEDFAGGLEGYVEGFTHTVNPQAGQATTSLTLSRVADRSGYLQRLKEATREGLQVIDHQSRFQPEDVF